MFGKLCRRRAFHFVSFSLLQIFVLYQPCLVSSLFHLMCCKGVMVFFGFFWFSLGVVEIFSIFDSDISATSEPHFITLNRSPGWVIFLGDTRGFSLLLPFVVGGGSLLVVAEGFLGW